MPEGDKKRAAHRALADRILRGPGQASQEQRAGLTPEPAPSLTGTM
jgi:hypothetical protein